MLDQYSSHCQFMEPLPTQQVTVSSNTLLTLNTSEASMYTEAIMDAILNYEKCAHIEIHSR